MGSMPEAVWLFFFFFFFFSFFFFFCARFTSKKQKYNAKILFSTVEIICWEQTSTSQFSITIHSHHCMACTLAEADHNPVGSSKRDKLWAFTAGRSAPALNHICRGMISVLTVSLKPAGLCWNTVAQNNHQRHTQLLFFFFFSFHLIFFLFLADFLHPRSGLPAAYYS